MLRSESNVEDSLDHPMYLGYGCYGPCMVALVVGFNSQVGWSWTVQELLDRAFVGL